MQTIENQFLKVSINPLGAELVSLFNKENHTEYMWNADPAFWGKSSPVLFPIVGALKNNQYFYQGKTYTLPRHGFARERVFSVEVQKEDSITFLLKEDEESLKVFPFPFEFRLIYTLVEKTLSVSYSVRNTGNEEMYFSVGGHPAFAVPLSEDTVYEDYYLEFNQTEDFQRWELADGGLIKKEATRFLENTNRLALTKELFYQDALVFKHQKSTEVILKSDKVSKQLKFTFENFPFLGIWAAINANFVCIEPWCGIADSENHEQELTEKEGIEVLASDQIFLRTWSVSL
ncbi:aldose 1-epimerase family protein [Arcicella lustrica]|uniref:Aldose 1-epimerase family protein n=1 Tax=Arcicella lustrica TaxID=2984196 RepID=A0ABU5SQ55_9BACT|nr:aldose 1-epimerase family protein [Arcicella sp. DC25W]MEA5429453.1 aldose 1-epimerase family protein [Arcicella sp. DC25W]